jgi:restriction endonuclease S subunit
MKLNEISNIQTGVYAKPAHHGDAIYLQSRHINESGKIDLNLQPDINLDNRIAKFILNSGDILFSAKGNKNTAVVYDQKLGPAVASSTFFVIRLTRQSVLPDYVSWFLNHPRAQKLLKAQAKGASPPSISIKTLYDLDIHIPNIDIQQDIIIVDALRKKEQSLIRQIEELKEQLMQQRIYHTLTNQDE